jgi:chromosome segregation ATPase
VTFNPLEMDNKDTVDGLEKIIMEQKEMLQHLHRRVQNHVKEKNDLIEMNEESERLIKKKEKLIEDISKYHRNSRDEHKEALAVWHKKKELSDKLIKTLQTENSDLKSKLENNHEFDKLVEEVDVMKERNKKKQFDIEELEKENQLTNVKLSKLEKENEELAFKIETIENEETTKLSEELGIDDPKSINVSYECGSSDKVFAKFETINVHNKNMHESTVKQLNTLNLKKMDLERKLNLQKLKIASDLFEVKKKEVSNEKCKCKSFCRIYHVKHNFRKSVSQEMINRFKAIQSEYSCDPCDKTFANEDSLKVHTIANHVPVSSREMETGGSNS